jgi:MFS family permease
VTAVAWRCLLAATALMALVMGTRTAAGLFLSPLNTSSGVGLAGLGFAVALGQLAQGLAQPPLGWLADRYGSRRLIVAGAWLLSAATMMLTLADSIIAFSLTFIAIAVAGTAVGSNSLLMAEVGRRVPAERRAMAFAIVGAGGSA